MCERAQGCWRILGIQVCEGPIRQGPHSCCLPLLPSPDPIQPLSGSQSSANKTFNNSRVALLKGAPGDFFRKERPPSLWGEVQRAKKSPTMPLRPSASPRMVNQPQAGQGAAGSTRCPQACALTSPGGVAAVLYHACSGGLLGE